MSQTRRLLVVLVLNIFMIAGLVGVGFSSHSLGVLAAAGDYLLDSSAIVFGLFAIYFRNRKGEQSKATIVVALLNTLLLLMTTVAVVVEAIHRLNSHAPNILALQVVVISSIAAIVMGIGVFILKDDADADDLHMKSVFLDTLADAVSAAAIAVTGLIILIAKRFYFIDSVVAVIIAIVIGYQSVVLLREVMQGLKK